MSGKRGGEEIGEGGRKRYEAKTVQCSLEGQTDGGKGEIE